MKNPFSNIHYAWLQFIVVIFVGYAHAEDSPPAARPEGNAAKKTRVLFIGNSLVYQNDLPGMLRTLFDSGVPTVTLETSQITPGGCTLERHWTSGKALAKIQEGNWDYVVLQEQSVTPIMNYESMAKHARLFDAEIRKVNAKTLFYMTWALRDSPQDHPKLTDAYIKIAKELGSGVVPVGHARAKAMEVNPCLDLYVNDGKHPSPTGTYLAACTFYVYLTGKPLKNAPCKISDPNHPEKVLVELAPDIAESLQKVAFETVQSTKN